MTYTLRPHQARAQNELMQWFYQNLVGDPIVDACVGSGKSVLIADFCKTVLTNWPSQRIIMIVASRELVRQNYERLLSIWPEAPVGVHSAGLRRKDIFESIIFASIGSVGKKAMKLGVFDLALIDECFADGTLIKTPDGDKPIEKIKPGDAVLNAIGIGIVKSIFNKKTDEVYCVKLSNGKRITVTGDHPFFTDKGWKKTTELENGSSLYSSKDLYSMWSGIQSMGEARSKWKNKKRLSRTDLGKNKILLKVLLSEAHKPYEQSPVKDEAARIIAKNTAQTNKTRRKWKAFADTSVSFAPCFRGWMGGGVSYSNKNSKREWLSNMLQAGYRKQGLKNWNRAGWSNPLREPSRNRSKEKSTYRGIWVESVSCLKSEGDRTVFNLHVSGHPSYFADGVLVHNCHNINPKEVGLYRQFISDMRKLNPMFRVIGYTGTPYRGNGVWLHKGETALFSGIATRISMREMLDNGYLAPLVLGKTETFIDASGVSMQSGDYNIKQLSKATDRTEITRAAVSEIIAMGTAQNRKSWAVYCVDAKHTQHVYEEFVSRGIKAGMITDKTPAGERDKILDDIKHKRIQAVVNCMILTVGWDHPELDLIALMRTTKSPVLYVQICGRGMRTHPSKDDCLWMDFTNTTAMMGPVDQVTGRDPVKSKGGGGAPFKICPACEEENPAGVRYCVKCDFEFPENFPVINPTASDAEILSSDAPVEKKRQVTKIMYYPHQKRGGDSNEVSLRVEYICGMQVFKEWVSIQSPSMYARAKAEVWWNVRSDLPIPKTVEDALGIIQTTPFREPYSITVAKNGKYDQVASYEF